MFGPRLHELLASLSARPTRLIGQNTFLRLSLDLDPPFATKIRRCLSPSSRFSAAREQNIFGEQDILKE